MSRHLRSSVRDLHAYVPGEQPDDPEIIKLNTNENPYPPPPAVAQVLRDFDATDLRRYPDPQCRSLRRALGERYGFASGQIIVGNGSDELLLLCLRAFVEQGGAVGWFEPSYSLYPVLAAIEGLRPKPVPLDAEFGWRLPQDYTAELFFITQPNAPTGLAFPREEIEAFCARFDGVVVLDEAYIDFAEASCLDLVQRFDNVICSRTFSKFASLAFVRCGYAFGPPELIDALYRIKDSYNVNGLTQACAEAVVQQMDQVQQQVERIKATRERVSEALRERGATVLPSQANFIFVCPEVVSAEEKFSALREAKILVRYFPGVRTGDWLRITIGTDVEMDALLAAW